MANLITPPTAPTVSTAWATQDVTDPETGAANKIQPPTELTESGLNRNEAVGRQYYNAILNNMHQHIVYLTNYINALNAAH